MEDNFFIAFFANEKKNKKKEGMNILLLEGVTDSKYVGDRPL